MTTILTRNSNPNYPISTTNPQPQNPGIELRQINQFDKYQVIKLIASGDYICCDKLGNCYLIVCQSDGGQRGVEEFFRSTKCKFHRNNNNRALLTPFEDIQYGGMIFTVFMIPQNATCIMDTPKHYFTSQIFCLSLLFSFINKIVKPLTEIFGDQAIKWIHQQNIWIKQNSVFYVLNERKLKKSNKPGWIDSVTCLKNIDKFPLSAQQNEQKQLLHRLCSILIPYLKIDHELKSFQSIIIDSIINEQFAINEIIEILTEKEKRKKFISQRIELNNQVVNVKEILRENGEFWKKKNFSYGIGMETRRGYRKYSHHLQNFQVGRNGFEGRGELSLMIDMPFSMKSKRNSLSPSGMFDFRRLSKKRKRSVYQQRTTSIYNNNHQTISRSGTKQINQELRSHTKYYNDNQNIRSVTMNVKQRAYRKFSESINHQPNDLINRMNQCQSNIKIRNSQTNQHGRQVQSIPNQKWQTIDICELISNPIKELPKTTKANEGNRGTWMEPRGNLDNGKYRKQESFHLNLTGNQNMESRIMENKLQESHRQQAKIVRSNSHISKQKSIQKQQSSITSIDLKQIPKQLDQDLQEVVPIKKNQYQLPNSKPIYKIIQQIPDLQNIQIIELATPKKTASVKMKGEMKNQEDLGDRKENRNKRDRQKSVHSSQSSNGRLKQNSRDNNGRNKRIQSISKQVHEYIEMINKLGESATKSVRIKQKLEGIQWFIGIYFIYKRFLFQRKKIQKSLQKRQPTITRSSNKNLVQWNQWFNSDQKKQLQMRIKDENKNILNSIINMNKKLLKKNLEENIKMHASLQNHSENESIIAVSQVLRQYDELDDRNKLNDEEIAIHINQLMASLYIIAELDGKITEKKPLVEISRKLNEDQLSNFANYIQQLCIPE